MGLHVSPVSLGASAPTLPRPQPEIRRPTLNQPVDTVSFGARTKQPVGIVATLGPASGSQEKIRAMADNGVTLFRLNYSHINKPEDRIISAQYIRWVREVSAEREAQGKPALKIFGDLQGPKIRVGDLPGEGIPIRKGESVYLSSDETDVRPGHIPVTLPEIVAALKPGNRVLLDDGKLELVVKEAPSVDGSLQKVRCEVVRGGFLRDGKGINLPGVKINIDSISEEDERDLEDALSCGVDAIAVSFVRSAEDLQQVRRLAKAQGREKLEVISKIEQQEALAPKALRQIVAASDKVLIARGDLALEIDDIAQLPAYERQITREARLQGKPVIMATQMLESMLNAPIPSRSDLAGIAAAVRDGCNFLMLSGETASGEYPVEATGMMRAVIDRTDSEITLARRIHQLGEALLDALRRLGFKFRPRS